ncbi:MAG: Fic family protein, partial [Deltaproteobacteria bacterium]|nr:Fic family protein [Deltaproteobacteria bacterium]
VAMGRATTEAHRGLFEKFLEMEKKLAQELDDLEICVASKRQGLARGEEEVGLYDTYGYLAFANGHLSIAYRTTEDDLDDASSGPGEAAGLFAFKNPADCPVEWLESLVENDAVSSLLAELKQSLASKEWRARKLSSLLEQTFASSPAWQPIKELSSEERSVDLSEILPLIRSWKSLREKLRDDSPEDFARFNREIIRSLSIETGILERLYDVERGTTETLILRGFIEDVVSRNATTVEPAHLIAVLRDHEEAVGVIMDCIAQTRPLTKGVLHELHRLITRNQDTTIAQDQFGRTIEVPLRKGAFKTQPNNPRTVEDAIHEYCPPIHVDTEIERLLALFDDYRDEPPLVLAAWLHHRFTQIHPYQDGNGRMARVLITYVLLRSDLLPVVIDRERRETYLDALSQADAGDLSEMVSLFAALERRAILQALSIEERGKKTVTVTKVIAESIGARLRRRMRVKDETLRSVNRIAQALRIEARRILEAGLDLLRKEVASLGVPEIRFLEGGPDQENQQWYKHDTIATRPDRETWINFEENHYFVKATFRATDVKLVFVTSFHHVGRELSGVMEVTAFAKLELDDAADPTVRKTKPCSPEPFVLTENTDVEAVRPSFDRWLDECLAVGIKMWGESI